MSLRAVMITRSAGRTRSPSSAEVHREGAARRELVVAGVEGGQLLELVDEQDEAAPVLGEPAVDARGGLLGGDLRVDAHVPEPRDERLPGVVAGGEDDGVPGPGGAERALLERGQDAGAREAALAAPARAHEREQAAHPHHLERRRHLDPPAEEHVAVLALEALEPAERPVLLGRQRPLAPREPAADQLERHHHQLCRRGAPRRLRVEQVGDQVRERLRHVEADVREPPRRLVAREHVLVEGALGARWDLAREAHEEERTQRVEVARGGRTRRAAPADGVDVAALAGVGVGPGRRDRRLRGGGLGGGGGRGDAEVDELVGGGRAAQGALFDDVGGPDVAVDDARLVDGDERRGDGDADVDDLARGQVLLVAQPDGERLAADVLHGEPDDAPVLVDGQRIEADDVGVLDPAEPRGLGDDVEPRLLAEPRVDVEELERRLAQRGAVDHLVRQPHRREPPAPELLLQPERADGPLGFGQIEQRMEALRQRGRHPRRLSRLRRGGVKRSCGMGRVPHPPASAPTWAATAAG